MILGILFILIGLFVMWTGFVKTDVKVQKNYIFGWHWFFRSWYIYLFQKFDDPGYCPWWEHVWCRINGHPNGVWYYNLSGSKSDYHCKDCGDEFE